MEKFLSEYGKSMFWIAIVLVGLFTVFNLLKMIPGASGPVDTVEGLVKNGAF